MQRKPVFDCVRELLGRGLEQGEVARLDAALDAALDKSGELSRLCTSSTSTRSVGREGIALIKRFEGCAKLRADGLVEAYPDPATGAEPWTIGWGATGSGIAEGTVWTQAQCDARLEADLARFAAEVATAIGEAPTTQTQFDALVSFHYNTGAIARATLTSLHRQGKFDRAEREFGKWIFAGGAPMEGLRRRRAAEAKLYAAI